MRLRTAFSIGFVFLWTIGGSVQVTAGTSFERRLLAELESDLTFRDIGPLGSPRDASERSSLQAPVCRSGCGNAVCPSISKRNADLHCSGSTSLTAHRDGSRARAADVPWPLILWACLYE